MVTTRSRSGSKPQNAAVVEKPITDGDSLEGTKPPAKVQAKRSSRQTGRQKQDSGSEDAEGRASQPESNDTRNKDVKTATVNGEGTAMAHAGVGTTSILASVSPTVSKPQPITASPAPLCAAPSPSRSQPSKSLQASVAVARSSDAVSSHPVAVSPPAKEAAAAQQAPGGSPHGQTSSGQISNANGTQEAPSGGPAAGSRGERAGSSDRSGSDDSDSSDEDEGAAIAGFGRFSGRGRNMGDNVGGSSSDDDDELDFGSEGMLSQLADSIRAAFHAQAGGVMGGEVLASGPTQGAVGEGGQQQQRRGKGGKQDVDIALNDDSDDELEELEREAEMLKWKPQVGLPVANLETEGKLAVVGEKEKGLAKQLTVPKKDARQLARVAKGAAPDTAGKGWFDLPAPRINDDLKRELRLLRLRNAFDPKHHYKSFDNTSFPKYFQVGTVVEGAAEFHSSRMTNRERKSSITAEVLHDPNITRHRKKRYNQMQEDTQKWSRHKRRKTEQPRDKARKPKPKH